MPLIPDMDAAGLSGELRCQDCDNAAVVALVMSLHDRSLQAFAKVADSVEKHPPPCPACGGRGQLKELRFSFDEPGLPELVYDPQADRLELGGKAISSEADIHQRIGRPFSVRDYHRLTLSQGASPLAYAPSPGVITLAVSGQGAQTEEQAMGIMQPAMELAAPLLHAHSPQEEQALMLPIAWSKEAAPSTWLGPLAQVWERGDLSLINIVVVNRLLDYVVQLADRQGLKAERDGDGVVLSRGELSDAIDVEEVAQLTIRWPLTLAEAAMYGLSDARRVFDCAGEVLSRLRSESWLSKAEAKDGMLVDLHLGEGNPVRVNLASLSRRLRFDPDAVVTRIREFTVHLSSLPGGAEGWMPGTTKRGCGCDPVVGMVLRPLEWVQGVEHTPLHRPLEDHPGLCACLVEDCPHALAYVVERPDWDVDLEALWKQAQEGLLRQQFEVFGHLVRDLEGRVHAAIWVGHNVSTCLLDERLLRGLLAQVRKLAPAGKRRSGHPAGVRLLGRGDEMSVVSPICDLVALVGSGADPDLVRLELAQVEAKIKNTPFGMSQPAGAVAMFKAKGPLGGRFEVRGLSEL